MVSPKVKLDSILERLAIYVDFIGLRIFEKSYYDLHMYMLSK